jgi:hypothetical protein
MLIGWVVVQLTVQIQVGVVGLLIIHSMAQGAIWCSLYVSVQEGKVVI